MHGDAVFICHLRDRGVSNDAEVEGLAAALREQHRITQDDVVRVLGFRFALLLRGWRLGPSRSLRTVALHVFA